MVELGALRHADATRVGDQARATPIETGRARAGPTRPLRRRPGRAVSPGGGRLGEQAEAQVEPQRPPPEPLAPRPVGAADGGAPVERAGRAPALPRAVGDRRRALAVVDDPARAGSKHERTPAAPARRPRSTSSPNMCSAGSNGPSRPAPPSARATQPPVSQLTSTRPLEAVGLGAGEDAAAGSPRGRAPAPTARRRPRGRWPRAGPSRRG